MHVEWHTGDAFIYVLILQKMKGKQKQTVICKTQAVFK